MKVYQWPCVCPICRHSFTAFVVDSQKPPADEVAADRCSLLCNMCEHRFVNMLYRTFMQGRLHADGVPIVSLSLSSMLHEAHRSGEPGTAAEVGTSEPARVSVGVQALPNRQILGRSEERIQGRMDAAGEALRGPTDVPPE